jgi:phage gpG-like protein
VVVVAREEKIFEEELNRRIRDAVFSTHRVIIEATPVRTGRLRGSIVVEEDEQGYIIGTNVPYAEHVEAGTSRMAGRHMFLKGAIHARAALAEALKR